MDHIEILRETIKYLRMMIELREHELAALNNLLTKAGEMEFNLRFPEPPTPGASKMINIYADGSCIGNPGPAGAGVAIYVDGEPVQSISATIHEGTNNIAELRAVELALDFCAAQFDIRNEAFHVFTDSSYAIGVLVGGWKAKKNIELIYRIREKLQAFPSLEMSWVKGHGASAGNLLADKLAFEASAFAQAQRV